MRFAAFGLVAALLGCASGPPDVVERPDPLPQTAEDAENLALAAAAMAGLDILSQTLTVNGAPVAIVVQPVFEDGASAPVQYGIAEWREGHPDGMARPWRIEQPRADGTLREYVSNDTWAVQVCGWAPGYVFASTWIRIHSKLATPVLTSQLVFVQGGRTVTGRIRDASGVYFPGTVRVTPMKEDGTPRGIAKEFSADGGGRFTIEGLDDGPFRIWARGVDPTGWRQSTVAELDLSVDATDLEIRIPEMRPRNGR